MRKVLLVVLLAACGGGAAAPAATTPPPAAERPPVDGGPPPGGVNPQCWYLCHNEGNETPVCEQRCPVSPDYDAEAHQRAVDYGDCMNGCMDSGGGMDECDAECEQ